MIAGWAKERGGRVIVHGGLQNIVLAECAHLPVSRVISCSPPIADRGTGTIVDPPGTPLLEIVIQPSESSLPEGLGTVSQPPEGAGTVIDPSESSVCEGLGTIVKPPEGAGTVIHS